MAVGVVLPFEGPLGSEIHIWRAGISDSCDILVYRYSRRHSISKGFPGISVDEESACNAGDLGSILGREDLLEKEMTTCSSVLSWRIPWTEESGKPRSIGSQRARHD